MGVHVVLLFLQMFLVAWGFHVPLSAPRLSEHCMLKANHGETFKANLPFIRRRPLYSLTSDELGSSRLSDSQQTKKLTQRALEFMDIASQPRISSQLLEQWERTGKELSPDIQTVRKRTVLNNIYTAFLERVALQEVDLLQTATFERVVTDLINTMHYLRPKTPNYLREFVDDLNDLHLTFIDRLVVLLEQRAGNALYIETICTQLCLLIERVFVTVNNLLDSSYDLSEEAKSFRLESWLAPVEARLQRRFPRYVVGLYKMKARQAKAAALEAMLRRIDFHVPLDPYVLDEAPRGSLGVYEAWRLADLTVTLLRQSVNIDEDSEVQLLTTLEARVSSLLRDLLAQSWMQSAAPALHLLHHRLVLSKDPAHATSQDLTKRTNKNVSSRSSSILSPDERQALAQALSTTQEVVAALYVLWQIRYNIAILAPPVPSASTNNNDGEDSDEENAEQRELLAQETADSRRTRTVFDRVASLPVSPATSRQGLVRALKSIPGSMRRSVSISLIAQLEELQVSNPLVDRFLRSSRPSARASSSSGSLDDDGGIDGEQSRKSQTLHDGLDTSEMSQDLQHLFTSSSIDDLAPYIASLTSSTASPTASLTATELMSCRDAAEHVGASLLMTTCLRNDAAEHFRALVLYASSLSAASSSSSASSSTAPVAASSMSATASSYVSQPPLRDAHYTALLTALLEHFLTHRLAPFPEQQLIRTSPPSSSGSSASTSETPTPDLAPFTSAEIELQEDHHRAWLFEQLQAVACAEEVLGTSSPRPAAVQALAVALEHSLVAFVDLSYRDHVSAQELSRPDGKTDHKAEDNSQTQQPMQWWSPRLSALLRLRVDTCVEAVYHLCRLTPQQRTQARDLALERLTQRALASASSSASAAGGFDLRHFQRLCTPSSSPAPSSTSSWLAGALGLRPADLQLHLQRHMSMRFDDRTKELLLSDSFSGHFGGQQQEGGGVSLLQMMQEVGMLKEDHGNTRPPGSDPRPSSTVETFGSLLEAQLLALLPATASADEELALVHSARKRILAVATAMTMSLLQLLAQEQQRNSRTQLLLKGVQQLHALTRHPLLLYLYPTLALRSGDSSGVDREVAAGAQEEVALRRHLASGAAQRLLSASTSGQETLTEALRAIDTLRRRLQLQLQRQPQRGNIKRDGDFRSNEQDQQEGWGVAPLRQSNRIRPYDHDNGEEDYDDASDSDDNRSRGGAGNGAAGDGDTEALVAFLVDLQQVLLTEFARGPQGNRGQGMNR